MRISILIWTTLQLIYGIACLAESQKIISPNPGYHVRKHRSVLKQVINKLHVQANHLIENSLIKAIQYNAVQYILSSDNLVRLLTRVMLRTVYYPNGWPVCVFLFANTKLHMICTKPLVKLKGKFKLVLFRACAHLQASFRFSDNHRLLEENGFRACSYFS